MKNSHTHDNHYYTRCKWRHILVINDVNTWFTVSKLPQTHTHRQTDTDRDTQDVRNTQHLCDAMTACCHVQHVARTGLLSVSNCHDQPMTMSHLHRWQHLNKRRKALLLSLTIITYFNNNKHIPNILANLLTGVVGGGQESLLKCLLWQKPSH